MGRPCLHMDDSRMTEAVFCGKLKQGMRDRGHPRSAQRPIEATTVTGWNRPFWMEQRAEDITEYGPASIKAARQDSLRRKGN